MTEMHNGGNESWWIATDDLRAGRGEKKLGPFGSRDLALDVRTYVEKVEGGSYWVVEWPPHSGRTTP